MLHHQLGPAFLHNLKGGGRLGKRHHIAHIDQRKGHLANGVFHAFHQIVKQKRMAVPRQPGKAAAAYQRFFLVPAQPDSDFIPAQIPCPVAKPFHGRHLTLKFGDQRFLPVQGIFHHKQNIRHQPFASSSSRYSAAIC